MFSYNPFSEKYELVTVINKYVSHTDTHTVALPRETACNLVAGVNPYYHRQKGSKNRNIECLTAEQIKERARIKNREFKKKFLNLVSSKIHTYFTTLTTTDISLIENSNAMYDAAKSFCDKLVDDGTISYYFLTLGYGDTKAHYHVHIVSDYPIPTKKWTAIHQANVFDLFCKKIPIHDNDIDNNDEQSKVCHYLLTNAMDARKQYQNTNNGKSSHKIYKASYDTVKSVNTYKFKDDKDDRDANVINPIAPRSAHGSMIDNNALRVNITLGINSSWGVMGTLSNDNIGVGFESSETTKYLLYINNIYMAEVAPGRHRHAAHAPPPIEKARAPGKEKIGTGTQRTLTTS